MEMMGARPLIIKKLQAVILQAISQLAIAMIVRSCPPVGLAETILADQKIALGGEVADPEAVVGQLSDPGQVAELKRIPIPDEDGLLQFGRLIDAAEHAHAALRIRLMRSPMLAESLRHQLDVIGDQQDQRGHRGA